MVEVFCFEKGIRIDHPVCEVLKILLCFESLAECSFLFKFM